MDGEYAFTNTLSLSGNVSLSRNRSIRYSVIDDNGNRAKLDGNPIAGFPDVLGNLRLTYRNEDVTASVLAKHVGSFYTDNFKKEEHKNDAYAVFNGEVLFRLPITFLTQFTARLEVRNIFNTLYFSSGEGNAFFPAAERNFVLGFSASF